MTDYFLAEAARASRITRDDLPKLGEWYWVKNEASPKEDPLLMCAYHVGSNHTEFEVHNGDSSETRYVMHWNAMENVWPEPAWREIINARIDETQQKMKQAVAKLADICVNANLISSEASAAPESLLPTTTRTDPGAYKASLLKVKEKKIPDLEKSIEEITEEMVGLNRNLFLGDKARMKRLIKSSETIEERLFALEMYAGFGEHTYLIREGNPPPMETPITIRQMIRYMDEEMLIDLEEGGMDFTKIEDFDRWVAKPEVMAMMLPEPRCIVAFQVRRNAKEYEAPTDLAAAFAQAEWHHLNRKTYLVIRNGEQLWRIDSDIDFKPCLIPHKGEFDQPFRESDHWGRKVDRIISYKDIDYDEHVEKRLAQMRHYNRVMFLIQGLLDRSKVFSPHPPIPLNDPDQIKQWIQLNHDEDDGLPSWNPPEWHKYRDAGMKEAKKGDIIYARFNQTIYNRFGVKPYEVRHHGYFRFEGFIKEKEDRNGKAYIISGDPRMRTGYERPRDLYDRGQWGDWPMKKRIHYRIYSDQCFNCDAYTVGDYKKFLADPYLKGAYNDWALYLLKAERYKQGKAEIVSH